MWIKIINVLMFGLMIMMNYLANSLPINGKTTGELSDQYPNLFVPAGITFSIWGVIYLLLLVFIFIQFRESNKSVVQSIGWAFALSSLLNGAWIVAWHFEKLPLSLAIMLGMLILLVYIGINISGISAGWVKAAFGVYLGWICIATIANITALLVNSGWNGWGFSDQFWTITMIIAGLLITAFAVIRLQNPFIGLAVIWAFSGIVIKQLGNNTPIVTTALLAIGIMVIVTFWLWSSIGFVKS